MQRNFKSRQLSYCFWVVNFLNISVILFCESKWNPGLSFLFLTLLIHVLIFFCSCNIISSSVLARWHHFGLVHNGAPSNMFLFHAVKCNLTELTTKSVCVPLRVCRIVRHMHRCIHLRQHSFMPSFVLWGTCTCASGRGQHSLTLVLFMHLCQCMFWAIVGRPVQ